MINSGDTPQKPKMLLSPKLSFALPRNLNNEVA
jgi:hypothetical protein